MDFLLYVALSTFLVLGQRVDQLSVSACETSRTEHPWMFVRVLSGQLDGTLSPNPMGIDLRSRHIDQTIACETKVDCSQLDGALRALHVQGYLAHKKTHHPRTLQ